MHAAAARHHRPRALTTLLSMACALLALLLTAQPAAAVHVLAGGYLDSTLTVQGGNLNIYGIADENATQLEVYYEGLPTGLLLPLINADGQYRAFHWSSFVGGPLGAGSLGVELVATNPKGDLSNRWPYLDVPMRSLDEYRVFVWHQADPSTLLAAEELATYLTWTLGSEVKVTTLTEVQTEAQLRDSVGKAGFFVNPHLMSTRGYQEFADLNSEWVLMDATREDGKTLYRIGGEGNSGTMYAVYRFLYHHGVRYFQPEDEWIPDAIVLQYPFRRKEGPAFSYRAYSWHTTHPIEIVSSTHNTDFDKNAAYTARVNKYFTKMHANVGAKGVIPGPAGSWYQNRHIWNAELVNTLGFLQGSGLSLHNTQQGGGRDIDWGSAVPVEEQIRNVIDARLSGNTTAKFFGLGFGTTEYTTTPFLETLHYLDYAGKYVLDNYPGVRPMINSHITGGEFSDEIPGVEYRDLGMLTDVRIISQWHTVMFYDLFHPAPCYARTDFTQKWRNMVHEANRPDGPRPQIFFPETSYWLSFDNAIPCFYPVYMYCRYIDMRAVKTLIPKGMFGHKAFSTGQEWGYWMGDYMVGQLHWNPDLNWTEVVDDFTTDIMGPAGPTVKWALTDMARYQLEMLSVRGLTKYMSGEDEIDEIGEQLGFQAQEIRVSFEQVNQWNAQQIQDFLEGDLNQVLAMARQYETYQQVLGSVRDQVPAKALPYFEEIYDGAEINALRCRHIWYLYQAVTTRRLNELNPDGPQLEFMPDYNMALDLTEAATEVIARREPYYRYPLEWGIGGSLDPRFEENNGTSFGYRYLHKTHLGFYWTRRNELAYRTLTGLGDPFSIGYYLRPAIAPENVALGVHLPQEPGSTVSIDFGDGSTGDETTSSHTYTGKGRWVVETTVSGAQSGQTYRQQVARVDSQAYAGSGSMRIVEPSSPLVGLVLGSIFPYMQFGLRNEGTDPFLAIGMDLNRNRLAESFTVQTADLNYVTVGAFRTEPSDLNIVIGYGSGSHVPVVGRGLVITGTLDAGQLQGVLELRGQLVIESIVQAAVLIGDGAFEPAGARRLIADILGVPVGELPDNMDIVAEITLEGF